LGQHHICDPFLRFYFRFLSLRQCTHSKGGLDKAQTEGKRKFQDFIETHTWEELCREWLLRVYEDNRLPFTTDQVGSAWNRKSRIDVVGIDFMQKTMILGDCKWSPYPIGKKPLIDLVTRTPEIMPKSGMWRVFYLGFSRGGWTDSAKDYISDLSRNGISNVRWEVIGGLLLDLETIDRDLTH
jgi:hypothetical protein